MTVRNGAGQEDGGGIYNCFGTLTVIDSIITGNRVRGGNGAFGYGAGIYNCPSSTLTIINTTFSRNSSGSSGFAGGILNGGLFQSTGTLAINNSTLGGNTADEGRGPRHLQRQG